MPRQCILTAAERSALLAFSIEKSELIRLYTFSEQDLSVIKQRRGDANRLGFAVLLCALRILAKRCRRVSGRRVPFCQWLPASSGSMKRFGTSMGFFAYPRGKVQSKISSRLENASTTSECIDPQHACRLGSNR
jgi:Domain of unknown function (DUF4158)